MSVTIEATVKRIIFRNEDNFYTVLSLEAFNGIRFVGVGKFHKVEEGQCYHLRGEWTRHPRYGSQFSVENYSLKLPVTEEAIQAFLSSKGFYGIGKVYAKKIVDHFGRDTLDILKKDPDRLQEVPGIGKKRLESLKRNIQELLAVESIVVELHGFGINTSAAFRIYKEFGADAVEKIRDNPYILTRVWGIGFKKADAVARRLNIPPFSPKRLEAGILYTLEEAAQNGHTCLPERSLIKVSSSLLEVSPDEVRISLGILKDRGEVKEYAPSETPDGAYCYLSFYHHAERSIAHHIRRLSFIGAGRRGEDGEIRKELKKLTRRLGFAPTDRQVQAVAAALTSGVSVITGGPGTGKTTIVKLLVEYGRRAGIRIALCSPTGRASKRLEEVTGLEAMTVHRLLKWKEGRFTHNADYPLDADIVVVDEASMLDVPLAYALLSAVPAGASIVFVGDADQLPSVGPGNVLRDIISSGMVPVVRLTEIHRQASHSRIVLNAHLINDGEFPYMKGPDFQLLKGETQEELRALVVELVKELIGQGCSPQDIQVLSPMKKGEAGISTLNEGLRDILNPLAAQGRGSSLPEVVVGDRKFRLGDRVIVLRNNYEKEVFNGDIGHRGYRTHQGY